MEPRPKRLLDQVRDAIRIKHYSPKTEESYSHWIKRYVLFHNKPHPREMNSAEIKTFLTHLAVKERVAASTP
ncbi:MAG: phage integrase N-terminal SAM-like domain-containing protein [Chloroflexi bacterium]|nr:phage integrase N-terminal SAM-like domain-containing protein [Chloroflexota bacterium]